MGTLHNNSRWNSNFAPFNIYISNSATSPTLNKKCDKNLSTFPHINLSPLSSLCPPRKRNKYSNSFLSFPPSVFLQPNPFVSNKRKSQRQIEEECRSLALWADKVFWKQSTPMRVSSELELLCFRTDWTNRFCYLTRLLAINENSISRGNRDSESSRNIQGSFSARRWNLGGRGLEIL